MVLVACTFVIQAPLGAQERVDRLKRAKLAQVMIYSIFSFGELGFQEYETSRYVTEILEENGFRVERAPPGCRRPGSRAMDRASQ